MSGDWRAYNVHESGDRARTASWLTNTSQLAVRVTELLDDDLIAIEEQVSALGTVVRQEQKRRDRDAEDSHRPHIVNRGKNKSCSCGGVITIEYNDKEDGGQFATLLCNTCGVVFEEWLKLPECSSL